jgi:hypothetical protein
MTDVTDALTTTRAAVDDFLSTAEQAGRTWNVPTAPGKWSPSQVAEHVARALEESANVVAGAPSKFPTFPAFLRPLVRAAFYNRVLKRGVFPRAKTNKPFDPTTGPSTPAAARARLEAALHRFEEASRGQAARGPSVASGIFGTVTLASYVRFQELHVRHHAQQLTSTPTE